MKNFCLFIIGLLLHLPFIGLSQSAWTRIDPLPVEKTINEIIKIPGTDRLMAVCDGSTIMSSDDSGETWDISINPAGMNNSYQCKGIYFVNETTGFINGGKETILKTTDAGLTWALKYQGTTIYEWQCINDIWFVDETTGFAVGNGGLLLTTSDEGESWQLVESGVQSHLMQIDFADDTHGFIFSNGNGCFKTTDGGLNWNWGLISPNIPPGSFHDGYFVNDTTGFVFIYANSPTDAGLIFKTTDAGQTWTEIFSDHFAYNGKFSDYFAYNGKFAFFDDQQGMFTCPTYDYQVKVMLTGDGGITWSEVSHPWITWWTNNTLLYIDENVAFSAGLDGRIFKTTDGGLTWQAGYNRYFPGRIFEVQFADEAVGFALADLSEYGHDAVGIKKTVDGGQHWSLIYGTGWTDQIDFYFVNASTGFCITEHNDLGSILIKTIDGGTTWVDMPTWPGFSRNDIKFYDENHGLMVGSGAIKTDDGGQSWNSVLSGSYNTIEYRSQQEVYIGGPGFGYDTQLLRSTDGGNTWETIYEGDTGPILDIALPDEQSIVINTREAIYKSDDIGQTWSEAATSNPDHLYLSSLSFPSPQVGYTVGTGDFTNMLKTNDGGNSWFPLDNRSTSGLNAVWFFNDEDGIVLGNGGLVLETTSGGITGTLFPSKELNTPSFSVAPNPFVGDINIRVKESNIEFPLQVTLTDITGRKLLNQQISGAVNQFSLPANNLKPGIYLCQIITRDGRTETIKLVRR
ncbi:MAG: YCF48-related protein [Lentimicrobium sp.]|jgi:photosystem II stability/assembly factor-like uncharacterized protein|nr:YCF48-related protein [Lentimicrobium sp.]